MFYYSPFYQGFWIFLWPNIMTTSQLSTDMLTLKEYESTDNLATCALPGRAETEYILCKISSSVIGGNGLVPPTLVDRKELNETFHQSNAYRLQRQNLMNSSIPRNMHHMRIENARLKREMKARNHFLFKKNSKLLVRYNLTNSFCSDILFIV